jgi:hypothetical protein
VSDEPKRERPVTTAELVRDAIRDGHVTSDAIVAHTQINPSAVTIALTNLYNSGVVGRELAPYGRRSRPGPRRYRYWLIEPS